MSKPLVVLVADHRSRSSTLVPLGEMLIEDTPPADAHGLEFD
jgi:hypothetical protein